MDDPNRAFARGELEARACARPASPPLRRRLHVTTDPEAPAPACAATSRDTSDDGGRADYATGGGGGENGGGFFWAVGGSLGGEDSFGVELNGMVPSQGQIFAPSLRMTIQV